MILVLNILFSYRYVSAMFFYGWNITDVALNNNQSPSLVDGTFTSAWWRHLLFNRDNKQISTETIYLFCITGVTLKDKVSVYISAPIFHWYRHDRQLIPKAHLLNEFQLTVQIWPIIKKDVTKAVTYFLDRIQV